MENDIEEEKIASLVLRLPCSFLAELKPEARARGLTVSALIRVILKDGLDTKYRERKKKS